MGGLSGSRRVCLWVGACVFVRDYFERPTGCAASGELVCVCLSAARTQPHASPRQRAGPAICPSHSLGQARGTSPAAAGGQDEDVQSRRARPGVRVCVCACVRLANPPASPARSGGTTCRG